MALRVCLKVIVCSLAAIHCIPYIHEQLGPRVAATTYTHSISYKNIHDIYEPLCLSYN